MTGPRRWVTGPCRRLSPADQRAVAARFLFDWQKGFPGIDRAAALQACLRADDANRVALRRRYADCDPRVTGTTVWVPATGGSRRPCRTPDGCCATTRSRSPALCAGSTWPMGPEGAGGGGAAKPQIEARPEAVPVGLAVNLHSLSECQPPAIPGWLELLSCRRLRWLMIAPDAMDPGRTRLLTGTGFDFAPLVTASGYRHRLTAPRYADPLVLRYGLAPTMYHLFELSDR